MNPDDLLHPIIVKYLHEAFDRLIAAYLAQNPGKLPSNTTCMELMQWSYRQTLDPHKRHQIRRAVYPSNAVSWLAWHHARARIEGRAEILEA